MRFKTKKTNKKITKAILIFMLGIFFYLLCFQLISLNYIKINNDSLLKFILSESNHNNYSNYNYTKIISSAMSYFTSSDITSLESLLDSNFKIENNKVFNDEDEDIEELKRISKYIEDPNKVSITSPIVYIYNTHQLENYSINNAASYSITPTVMMASYILKESLNKAGIPTIVEEGDVTSVLNANNWKYARSYRVTRSFMESIVLKEPTLKYFIDVHRDSVSRKYTTLTSNDKTYAKVLFVIGLENPTYEPNLEFANKISDMINKKVSGLSKGILKKEGAGVNGVYNQDFSPNTMLLEVGGVDNTIDEVNNTLEVVSDVLIQYIKENK